MTVPKTRIKLISLVVLVVWISSCTFQRAELGTPDNPIKFFFVPSVDAKVISEKADHLKRFLEKNTPYKFETSVPQSFIAVVEAFGTKRADVAALNTFGYLLANEKYQAQARMKVMRHGSPTYQAGFFAGANSGIKKLEDLDNKKFAFVDPASTSGYLLPLKTLKDRNIKIAESVFAMKHDSVVTMIYQGQVDAGATYYSPPDEDGIQDARRMVKTQYPDVEKKVVLIELSQPLPNDPIVFRADMPESIKIEIVQALLKYVATPEGKSSLKEILGATELITAQDADYDSVRDMLKALGKSASEVVKK